MTVSVIARKLGELLSACAALVLFTHSAWAQLYPFPSGTPLAAVVGPSAPTVGHIAVFGTAPTPGTISITDGGSFNNAPQATNCPTHQYVFSYPTAGGSLSCKQPSTSDLSDIGTFNLSTTGGVAAVTATITGSITGASAVLSGAVTGSAGIFTSGSLTLGPWSIAASLGGLSFQLPGINGNTSIFAVDSGGIFTLPTAFRGSGVPQLGLGSGLPIGGHSTVQAWFEVRDSTGVIRYVPGF